ncbi:hypothetical protein ER308_13865 [Egibacter rhizosphaerae]|uniref:Uncharacterized protein n=1 Tax=Egibacter rhizosphaerae TaxID=1670831 RepID=A0A411YH32_9ACTN|nr:hypothetical protein [Egibacter rhizosphaerae]QBI20543.1 hypothetical protein ER308_13865 [Egibacter rhizosphaerae]
MARDLAVMLIDGGEATADLARRDPDLFGEHAGQHTASQPTAWRTIEAIAADELVLTRCLGSRGGRNTSAGRGCDGRAQASTG